MTDRVLVVTISTLPDTVMIAVLFKKLNERYRFVGLKHRQFTDRECEYIVNEGVMGATASICA